MNQATIYSQKPFETVEFYRKLGLHLIVDSLPRYARLEFPDGDATLSVHITDEDFSVSNIVLYFECDDLDERVSELKNLGLQFESEPQDKSWLWRETYLKDPKIAKIRRGV